MHDGTFLFPSGSTWPAGSYPFSIDVLAGETVGFGAWSDDCWQGAGTAVVSDFVFQAQTFEIAEGAVDPRPWTELAGGTSFGTLVAPFADFDGDGRDDLLVLDADAATVHVVRATDGVTLASRAVTSGLDTWLVDAGDVDGDGTHDFALADPKYDGFGVDTGRMEVVSGATGAVLFDREGASGAKHGQAVAGAGDVNGDGYDDVVYSTKFGTVMLAGPDGTPLHTTAPAFGLAGVDDWDGDGMPDFAVSGNPGFGETSHEVRSGLTGDTIEVATENGFSNGPHRVLTTPDIDGDGAGDVAYLSQASTDGAAARRVLVRSGATGEVIQEIRRDGETGFASSIAAAGDADGDGVSDLAISSVANDAVLITHALDGGGPAELRGEGGPLVAGAPLALQLTRGVPNAPAVLLVGLQRLDLPYKDGVIVPDILIMETLPTDASGDLTLAASWPAGVPQPTVIWTQFWMPDADATQGLGASNGLGVMTPAY